MGDENLVLVSWIAIPSRGLAGHGFFLAQAAFQVKAEVPVPIMAELRCADALTISRSFLTYRSCLWAAGHGRLDPYRREGTLPNPTVRGLLAVVEGRQYAVSNEGSKF